MPFLSGLVRFHGVALVVHVVLGGLSSFDLISNLWRHFHGLAFRHDVVHAIDAHEQVGVLAFPGAGNGDLHALGSGEIILTLGADGAVYYNGSDYVSAPAFRVNAVDTTGAGDTFTGYCLYELLSGSAPYEAMLTGCAASAIEVTKPGAAETIPNREEVMKFLKNTK
jgi:ribokinase